MLGGMVQQLVNRTRARQSAEENRRAPLATRGEAPPPKLRTQSSIASARELFCDPGDFFGDDSRSGKSEFCARLTGKRKWPGYTLCIPAVVG